MKVKQSKIICKIKAEGKNARNSEGSFVKLPDGNILFAYSRYVSEDCSDDAPCQVSGITLSKDGEKVLTDMHYTLVDPKDYGVKNAMSVSLGTLKNGDISLICVVKAKTPPDKFGREHQFTYAIQRTSKDGRNFDKSTDSLIIDNPLYGALANDRFVRLKSGRIILPAYFLYVYFIDGKFKIDERSFVQCYYSDDEGKTWKKSETKNELSDGIKSVTGVQEPTLVEMPDGRIKVYARTDLGAQWESMSYDNGITFTPMSPSPFSSAISPMNVKKNPYNGKLYAIFNPVPNYVGRTELFYCGGRTPLVLAESDENGDFINTHITSSAYGENICMKELYYLENDENKGYAYPSIFFLDEKTILIAYGESEVEYGGTIDIVIKKIVLE